MARRPDFFFVGHPRSGSGLLDSYLKGHPDIFMARKELHYFGEDLGYHRPRRSLENYLQHFSEAGDEERVGEASTWTLISQTAASEIAEFDPQAQAILLLRDPVSWLHSLHSHLVFSGDEPIGIFEEALSAEEERVAGRSIPEQTIPRCALNYRQLVRYTEQVQRFWDALGRDRVLVLILDDMKTDAEGVYDQVLDFLSLPRDFPGRAAVVQASQRSRNQNRSVRSGRLRDFIAHPRRRRILEGVDPAPVPGWGMTIRLLRRANIRYEGREPMKAATRAMLSQELAPAVRTLESLLERTLPWCQD
jgi:hypothetical protein